MKLCTYPLWHNITNAYILEEKHEPPNNPHISVLSRQRSTFEFHLFKHASETHFIMPGQHFTAVPLFSSSGRHLLMVVDTDRAIRKRRRFRRKVLRSRRRFESVVYNITTATRARLSSRRPPGCFVYDFVQCKLCEMPRSARAGCQFNRLLLARVLAQILVRILARVSKLNGHMVQAAQIAIFWSQDIGRESAPVLASVLARDYKRLLNCVPD